MRITTLKSLIKLASKDISHLTQLKAELKEELKNINEEKNSDWEIIKDLEMVRIMIKRMREHENKLTEELQIKTEEEKTNGN